MGVGGDSLEVKYPAKLPDFLSPTQTPSNAPPLLAALNDLSTPCIIQWYGPYLYGKYSIGFDFSLMGHPPSYLATESMAHFLFDPRFCAPAL